MRVTVRRLHRSLFAQLCVLSAIFVFVFLVQAVIVPYWGYTKELNPLTYTRGRVATEIFRAVAAHPKNLDALDDNEFLRQVAAKNPHFRYFIEVEAETKSYGGPPRRVPIPESAYQLSDADGDVPVCSVYTSGKIEFEENGIPGYARFNNCPGRGFYIEIAGISADNFSYGNFIRSFFKDVSFGWVDRYLVIASGLLLIAAFTIYQAVRSLRGIMRVAQEIDLDKTDMSLPDQRVPIEVQPLVRALNQMLGRIGEARQKQSFFLAAAAHELRTPLTILRTRLEELPDGEVKEAVRGDVHRIARLVEQLLKLTSLNAVQELATEQVDLVAVARNVCANRAPLAIERGVDIELKAEDDTTIVAGNKDMISAAVVNLVDNGLSVSTPGGHLQVEVSPAGFVSVRDHGPGVPEDAREAIFEPFNKNPPNRPGTGLGLAIVKAVMSLHRGSVDQKNASDGGAVFTLRFNTGDTAARAV